MTPAGGRARVVLAPVLALGLLVACGDGRSATTGANSRPHGGLTVFAAASLSEAFGAMGDLFRAEHPGVEVTFNFAGSSSLAQQLAQGAPADVFASADQQTMDSVVAAGDVTGSAPMARNRLAILVENGNPLRISGLADLERPGVIFVACAPVVPCGRLAAAALDRAGVEARPDSLEENVKAVASKVVLGEGDAGIVYATDVRAAGARAQGVEIDVAGDPALEAVYSVAVTTGASNPDAARAWLELVLSDRGQSTLRRFGFLPP